MTDVFNELNSSFNFLLIPKYYSMEINLKHSPNFTRNLQSSLTIVLTRQTTSITHLEARSIRDEKMILINANFLYNLFFTEVELENLDKSGSPAKDENDIKILIACYVEARHENRK